MSLDPSPVHSRVAVAFTADALVWSPAWTGLDATYPSLVTSYSIDRGRQYELDRTDTGRATVEIADRDGVLDPTNPASPYVGKIEPLKQVLLNRFNPVDGNWYTRFRGWIEEYDYTFHPSQRVNMLTLSCVDIFEILAAIEMQPGAGFGDPVPAGVTVSPGGIFFDSDTFKERIDKVLDQAGPIPTSFRAVFSGNTMLWGGPPYSAGETVLTVIQDAADAEFPGVSNVYADRYGRLAAHGRVAKFDPAAVIATVTPDQWEWHSFKAGDQANVAVEGSAFIHRFAVNRGLAKIINTAKATPVANPAKQPLTAAQEQAQLVTDTVSQGHYGIRSWSAENLLTLGGLDAGGTVVRDSLVETHRFAEYYVGNYSVPRNRITDIAFRSTRTTRAGHTETWRLLSQVDISDEVIVTIGSPGGGGLDHVSYFVEGVHEQVQPLNPDMDDVTLSLDLSPRAYYTTLNPWA